MNIMVYGILHRHSMSQSKNAMDIKAVVFDMDGVLIDTEKYLTTFWCQAANEAGFPMTMEHALEIRSLSGPFASKKLKSIFGDSFDYEKIRSRRKELMNTHLKEKGIEIKPYVKECICELRDVGYRLAVATSTDSIRTEKYLREISIFEYFNNIICANMVSNGKPEPDIYIYTCNKLGLDPSQCVAIEDSPNGVESAYRSGMNVIMIPDLAPADEHTKKMLNFSIKSMAELPETIKQLQLL